MKKFVVAGLLVAGFATPAFAAEYYVAQNNSTHKCSILSKKPDGKTLTMLGTEGRSPPRKARSRAWPNVRPKPEMNPRTRTPGINRASGPRSRLKAPLTATSSRTLRRSDVICSKAFG